MEIYERIKDLRKNILKLNQEDFSKSIGLSRSNIANIEVGRINLTDRVVSDICKEFNVNEEWLRNGNGEMFLEPDTFSLDEYVKQRGMTEEELDIIKGVFEIPEEFRRQAIEYFKIKILPALRFDNDIVATKENIDIVEIPIEEKSVSELEMEYKKNLLKNASKQTATVSSITEDKKKAQ